ncbi:hypothetical protein [Mesorhizobium sp. Z1-4]|uniref:hypothetical protein n=1 Tax=Mesorhizobium sp. Z1-4 TaxID=2448478 RepID=UPI000FD9B42E|nr:hypothetical protein [Mesorhizobium sp. Z1-4]
MALVLMAGALVWALSEVLELLQGGFTPLNSGVSAVAFVLIGIGVWALWRERAQNRLGQAGIAMLSIGMVLFALVAVQVMSSGITSDAEIADTPIFLLSGGLVSIGALLLGWWLVAASPFPKWIGAILVAATLFTLAVAFVPAIVALQPVSNLVLAAVLGRLGWQLRSS